jgi:hypothetical protein
MNPKKRQIKPQEDIRQLYREQQLRDIATSGNQDAAECAASDAFKEFPFKEVL